MTAVSQGSKEILDQATAIPARAIHNAFTEALRKLDVEVWPKTGRQPTRSEILAFVENIRFEIYKKSRVTPPSPSKTPPQTSEVPTDSRAEYYARRARLPSP